MLSNFGLKPPFFELGPKAYLYGEESVKLAQHMDQLALKYKVDIIYTAQLADIHAIAKEVKHIYVFAQHMDDLKPGRGLGSVLPESVKAAGAAGVMLNHAECPLPLGQLNRTIKRADNAGLASIACADSIEEGEAVAHLNPNLIILENPEIIGGGKRSENDAKLIHQAQQRIKAINSKVMILHGAGIHNENDVYNIIFSGSDGTGSTSGVILAENPFIMAEKMIKAVRTAWDDRCQKNGHQ